MSTEDAYREAARVLSDRGYVISASDAVLRSITTDWKSVSGVSAMRIRMIVDEKGGTNIRVRGDFLLGVNVAKELISSSMNEDPPSEITEIGMRGSPARNAWNELEAVAMSFEGFGVERILGSR